VRLTCLRFPPTERKEGRNSKEAEREYHAEKRGPQRPCPQSKPREDDANYNESSDYQQALSAVHLSPSGPYGEA
jgi:hypothetical protein